MHTKSTQYTYTIPQNLLILLPPRFSPPNPSILPLIPPSHQNLTPRPLAPLPEPTPPLPNHAPPTKPTRLRVIFLLPRTPPANHPTRPLAHMPPGLITPIMALITGEHLPAARESEPPITPLIMRTGALVGEGFPGVEAEFLLATGADGRGFGEEGRGRVDEELDFRERECEAGVAFAADVGCCFAADGGEAGGGGEGG